MRPTTNFATLGNDRIGYQVLGQGPVDLVFLTGMSSHLDLRWDEPLNEYFLHRLASFSRLILFDRRGTGVSDPVPSDHLPTWEEWADDMRVVLEAYGLSEKDLQPRYLKPGAGADHLARGEVEGFTIVGGTPVSAVSDVAGRLPVRAREEANGSSPVASAAR